MIEFYNKKTNRCLARYSEYGTFAGELTATKELLSYEKKIPINEIGVKRV